MSIPFTFIAILLVLLYFWIKRGYSYWQRNKVPFVKPTLPFGNFKIMNNREHLALQLAKFYRENTADHPILGLYAVINPVPLIVDLKLVQSILIKDFQCFQSRGTYFNEKTDPLSAHMFNLNYERWRPLRTKLAPAFSKAKYMFPAVVAIGHELVNCINKMIETDCDVEIRDVLARFTTDVIGTCAFGLECNSLKDPNGKFRRMGKKVVDEPKTNFVERLLIKNASTLCRLVGLRLHHQDVTEFFTGIVHATVDYREKNDIRRNDFMDLLIQLKNARPDGITIDEIAAQAFVFFLAGFDTTTATLSWCLYELTLEKNKHIQDKLRHEIQSILSRHNEEVTYEALAQMPYLEQVINETLRKHPSVSVLPRLATKDYNVPNTNYTIPKEMLCLIPVFGIHHNPLYYEEPEQFIPERFSPEEIKKRPPCSFLPFGDGPRNCIGMRFAKIQLRIGLISILRNFELSTCRRTDLNMGYCPKRLVLSPANAVWIKVSRVHNLI